MNSSIKSKIVAVVTIISGQEIVDIDREYRDHYRDGSREFGVNVYMGNGTWYNLVVGTNEKGGVKYAYIVHFAPIVGNIPYSDAHIDIPKNHPRALPHWEELIKDVVEYLNSI